MSEEGRHFQTVVCRGNVFCECVLPAESHSPWRCCAPQGCPQTSSRWAADCTSRSAATACAEETTDWTVEYCNFQRWHCGGREWCWPEGRRVVIVELSFQDFPTLGLAVGAPGVRGQWRSFGAPARWQRDVVLPILQNNTQYKLKYKLDQFIQHKWVQLLRWSHFLSWEVIILTSCRYAGATWSQKEVVLYLAFNRMLTAVPSIWVRERYTD